MRRAAALALAFAGAAHWIAAGATVHVQDACAPAGAVRVATEPLSAEQMTRELLLEPGTVARPGLASPTRVPWVNANGWRYVRKPQAKYRYELPEGKGALAAAEALAYAGDAVLQIAPGDLPAVCRLFALVKDVPAAELPGLADIGVIDDESPVLGEVMNLLVRRNLLFAVLVAPQMRFAVNVRLNTPEYSLAEAADPSAIALKIRRQLTDERRSLRIFGSEVVIGRLTGDATRVRLHLVNYGSREISGLRVRVRGTYREAVAYIPDQGRVAVADFVAADGATEFSVPILTTYAIVDLR
ncbi:MAG TPA: hypothetical protein VFJ02_14135 [Vicinamibacterales bacterium]|nr:hypothetical protein [Vicinamibacterales bacterium]